MKIIIIGGGASGFFAAITLAAFQKNNEIIIVEKSNQLLSKVKVSGGGRCNVTHACFDVKTLLKSYPRGSQYLKKAFHVFNPSHTIKWFEDRHVRLKTEPDGRMFPMSDSSQTIIDCFLQETKRYNIKILQKTAITRIVKQKDETFILFTQNGQTLQAQKVIVATGGSPKIEGFSWLKELGHEILAPVPSLFTFNMPTETIRDFQGVSLKDVQVNIVNEFEQTGDLLITHWGMSGPAILKSSAWAARYLQELNYQFDVKIKWINSHQEAIRQDLLATKKQVGRRQLQNHCPWEIPKRLWEFFLEKLNIPSSKTWAEIPDKDINRLTHLLTNDIYKVNGKTTFKEEFVTCGGISLENIHLDTMESKHVPGLYFTGEVLDIDGITGGFNFQAAWTTAYLAATHIAQF